MMPVVGLTGGIASGKSTVAQMLRSRGGLIIDADQIAREVVAVGSKGLQAVVEAFGPEILHEDGSLNRAFLGRIVFADAAQRECLEQITHPFIIEKMQQQLQVWRKSGALTPLILDVPLLFETPALLPFCDCTVVVWVPEDVQAARLRQRDGYCREEIKRRLDAQMPLGQKRELADFVIDNSGTRASTYEQVERLWADLRTGRCKDGEGYFL